MGDRTLDGRIEESLREVHAELEKQVALIPQEKLNSYYELFRSRFGPDKLTVLDGTALLNLMHAHGNEESLVYWLEFKNDQEFPGTSFGSIAGGSAHKFGLFRRAGTTQWVSGRSFKAEKNITAEEAVVIARKHRAQLVAGAKVLQRFPSSATDKEYLDLQGEMDNVAPDIGRLGWGHKYFSLLFPEKLDEYHSRKWQRFNLLTLLRPMPPDVGLYASAGRFVALAKKFGWPINHLTVTLSRRNGRPVKYWRFDIALGDQQTKLEVMRESNVLRVETENVADLSLVNEGDIVAITKENVAVAIGRITGPHFYGSVPKGNCWPLEWISFDEWPLPNDDELRAGFARERDETNLLEIERHLQGDLAPGEKHIAHVFPTSTTNTLDGIAGRIQAILERKKQIIIYGPPGTGKTFWANVAAHELSALTAFGKSFSELSQSEIDEIDGREGQPGLVRMCTFHPAYGYEDFIEGYRPALDPSNRLQFQRRDGIFTKVCNDAHEMAHRNFYLIIDEINRGDIPRIFGELLTLLEKDKRNKELLLPLSGKFFSVPPNVFVLATMNTADRSIALLDTALRRRFGFLELMPDVSTLKGISAGPIPLAAWLSALNERILVSCGRDARNLQVGHAYFMENGRPIKTFAEFVRIFTEEIIPLLQEYTYEDYTALKNILGDGLIDEDRRAVRSGLFVPDQQERLVQALLALSPEIGTSLDAVESSETFAEPDDAAESDEDS